MTKEKKMKSRIPEFKSREEMAEFWDTHSLADYWDEFKPVKVKFAKHLSERSVVKQTAGALKSNLPALTPQEERKSAEEGIAEEAIKRMGG
jgi:hypothetical protein